MKVGDMFIRSDEKGNKTVIEVIEVRENGVVICREQGVM